MKKADKLQHATAAALAAIILALIITGCGGGGGAGLGVGDRGGDMVKPVITLSTPAAQSTITDVDLREESFYIQINYYDTSPMNIGSLTVQLKMDSGSNQTVTEYFTAPTSSAIRSQDIYNFTRTLFDISTNDQDRVITLTASIKDIADNTGALSATFTVTPYDEDIPPVPEFP